MIKHSVIVIIALVALQSVRGQQDVQYSQYMFDKMLLNPAYAGSSQWMVGSVKNRMQLVNLDGSPVTNLFTFQAPVQVKNIGLGVKIVHDKIAVTKSFTATAFFSYHIGFGKGKLSFGLEGGIINNSFNYSGLNRIVADDPAIANGAESVLRPDVSTGLFYQSSKYYLGASVYHLFDSRKSTSFLGNNDSYTISRDFYGIGGYMFDLSKKVVLEPSFLLRYAHGAPLQADMNLSLILLDRVTFGTSFRTGDAVIGLIKIDVTKNLKILYSFDYTISTLAKYSSGSHEIGISYGIELLPPPEQKVIHPRYYF